MWRASFSTTFCSFSWVNVRQRLMLVFLLIDSFSVDSRRNVLGAVKSIRSGLSTNEKPIVFTSQRTSARFVQVWFLVEKLLFSVSVYLSRQSSSSVDFCLEIIFSSFLFRCFDLLPREAEWKKETYKLELLRFVRRATRKRRKKTSTQRKVTGSKTRIESNDSMNQCWFTRKNDKKLRKEKKEENEEKRRIVARVCTPQFSVYFIEFFIDDCSSNGSIRFGLSDRDGRSDRETARRQSFLLLNDWIFDFDLIRSKIFDGTSTKKSNSSNQSRANFQSFGESNERRDECWPMTQSTETVFFYEQHSLKATLSRTTDR